MNSPTWRRSILIVWVAFCGGSLFVAGCSDPHSSAGIVDLSRTSSMGESSIVLPQTTDDEPASNDAASGDASDAGPSGDYSTTTHVKTPEEHAVSAVPDRTFAAVGPAGAIRVGFNDLDLLQILKMDPVTPDCVEKMPGWLRGLNGKKVRIRGYMKPISISTGLPQFMFVRDMGLCCFGPKGKIYDMIAVTLKQGTTTDYLEFRPFDVVGTFRIEVLKLEDEDLIYGLYYIDDAAIVN